jgi:hypothetical protein
VGRGDGRRPPVDQLTPPASSPDESPAGELLAADGEVAEDDEADDDPAAVAGSAAVVPVAPSESRTTRRGFAGLGVEALAEGSGTLAAVDPADASFASAVSATIFADVTWSDSLTASVGVSCWETSALTVSFTEAEMAASMVRISPVRPINGHDKRAPESL